MPDVARHFWGEPNRRHSSTKELRWGTNGARSVDVAKGTWFDHEAKEGGGVIDFLKREGVREIPQWLKQHGLQRRRRRSPEAVQDRRDLRLHRRIRRAAVPGLPSRAEVLSPAAPGTPGRSAGQGEGWLGVERQRRAAGAVPPARVDRGGGARTSAVRGRGRKGRSHARPPRHPGDLQCRGRDKWHPGFAEHLAGADVIVIPDNDKDGHEHAQEVARSLVGKAARIRVVELPGLPDKGDVSDWFAAGGTVEEFNALVDQAPDWTDNGTPPPDETPQHNGRILRGTEFADLSTSSKKVWLVHHLLAIGEISVWYGEPGSGKSVGIEDLGLHVAVGRAWHGRQVKQCAVLYVALERAGVVAAPRHCLGARARPFARTVALQGDPRAARLP